MKDKRGIRYSGSSGLKLIQSLYSQGQFVFSIEDADQIGREIGLSPFSVRICLSEMIASGWIKRIRRGLYVGTGSLPGFLNVPSFVIATQLVRPSAISHWSALSHHDLIEQIPQQVFATTTKKVVTPSMRDSKTTRSNPHSWIIEGVSYRFITVKPEHFFGWEEVWLDEHFRVPVFVKERALLDIFATPRLFGGISLGLEILENHLQELEISKLVEFALKYGVSTVSRRLGWALERMGVPLDSLALLLPSPLTSYQPFDPTRPKSGSYNKRWKLIINLPGMTKNEGPKS